MFSTRHRCASCSAPDPPYIEREADEPTGFCSNVCQAVYHGVFTANGMNHSLGASLELPDWAVFAKTISGANLGSWYTNAGVRGHLEASGASDTVLEAFDRHAERNLFDARFSMQIFLNTKFDDLDATEADETVYLWSNWHALNSDYAEPTDMQVRNDAPKRIFLTPAVPDALYQEFKDFMDVRTKRARRGGNLKKKFEIFQEIVRYIVANDDLVSATADNYSSIMGMAGLGGRVNATTSPPRERPVKFSGHIWYALNLMDETYGAQAKAFGRKTELGYGSYTLKAGELMFKAASKKRRGNLNLENTDIHPYPFWLAFTARPSLDYIGPDTGDVTTLSDICHGSGAIAVYRVKEDVELVDMQNVENIKSFLKILTASVSEEPDRTAMLRSRRMKMALETAFPIKDEGTRVGRASDYTSDARVAEFLASIGKQGYTTRNFGGFPAEVMLLDASKHLETVRIVEFEDMGFPQCAGRRGDNPILGLNVTWRGDSA